MAKGWGLLPTKFPFAKIEEGEIEAAQGAEQQEDACVGGCGVDDGGDIRESDAVGGEVGDVALVVAGAWYVNCLAIAAL